MTQRKLCLVGDFFNLGDAFLAEIEALHMAAGRTDVRVTLAPYQAPPPGMTEHFARQRVGVLSMRARPLAFLAACLRSDVYMGGGHVVREAISYGWLLLALAGCWLSRLAGHRIALVGAGVTPVKTPRKQVLWRWLLRSCGALGVRDEQSARTLRELVPPLASRVRVCNDVAFLASFDRSPAASVKRIAVVSPAIDLSEARDIDADRIVRLIDALRQRGLIDQVCFLAHDIRPELDGDCCVRLAERVSRELKIPVSMAAGELGSRLVDSYRSAAVIVTGRLHGLIAGALLRKPVLYTGEAARKLRPFGDRFGFPCVQFDAADWPAEVERVIGQVQTFDAEAAGSTLERLRREACVNFE